VSGSVSRIWLALPVLMLWTLLTSFMPWVWDAQRMLAVAQTRGPEALAGARALQAMLAAAAAQDDAGKLRAVNDFFNHRIAFRDDQQVWGSADYWASPLELLERGAGDCEDFAIAKYFSLLALGLPAAGLRLVYARIDGAGPPGPGRSHMVLAHRSSPGAEPQILDNLVDEIRSASARPDLLPVFSFNREGLWHGIGSQPAQDPTSRLAIWREVLVKAREEGFQ